MNKKFNRTKFVKETIAKLLNMGAVELPKEYSYRVFRIEGKKNSITFRLEPENEHKICYSLFAKFDKLNKLTGHCNHKHNFHDIDPDCMYYLAEIEKYLN